MFRTVLIALSAVGVLTIVGNSVMAQNPYGAPGERFVQWSYPYTITDYYAQNFAHGRPWHGQHYYLQYGQPTALVVPPTASMQTVHSWGVSQNRMHPTYHQFGRPVSGSGGGMFYGTPRWPSHSNQFGVYPVRAPW